MKKHSNSLISQKNWRNIWKVRDFHLHFLSISKSLSSSEFSFQQSSNTFASKNRPITTVKLTSSKSDTGKHRIKRRTEICKINFVVMKGNRWMGWRRNHRWKMRILLYFFIACILFTMWFFNFESPSKISQTFLLKNLNDEANNDDHTKLCFDGLFLFWLERIERGKSVCRGRDELINREIK